MDVTDVRVEPERGTLSKDDMRALREATTVSFHHWAPGRGVAGGFIRASKRIRRSGPFAGDGNGEVHREIRVGSEFQGKHATGDRATPDNSQCFTMICGSDGAGLPWRSARPAGSTPARGTGTGHDHTTHRGA